LGTGAEVVVAPVVGGNLRLRFTASKLRSYGNCNSAFYKISTLHRDYLSFLSFGSPSSI
jgi:hypothetical protein